MANLQPVPLPHIGREPPIVDLRDPEDDGKQLQLFPHLVIVLESADDPQQLPAEMTGMYYLG